MSDDERWDLVDQSGARLGRTHRRGDAEWPGDGVFHVVAAVCVVRGDGRVLVTQRAAVKDHPLMWEFPAGSVLTGETSAEGARRELGEETGLDAPVDRFSRVVRLREERALVDIYLLRWCSDAALALDPDEVAAAKWVAWSDIDHLCHRRLMAAPWVRRLRAIGPELRAAASIDGGRS